MNNVQSVPLHYTFHVFLCIASGWELSSPHSKICLQFESFIIVLFGVHILLHIRKVSDHFPCFQLFFLGYQVLEIYKIIYL